MLRHLGEVTAAKRVEAAVHATLDQPALRTRDLGGQATTDEFTNAVIARLA
jgi:isocitrate/isopropylmalate dehydrogenase